MYVCDLVDAHVLGLKWLQSGRGSRVLNLGTGDGFSVRRVIDESKHVTNRLVPVIHGVRRPGDCTKLVSVSLRAKTELGWSADRSNLKRMIPHARPLPIILRQKWQFFQTFPKWLYILLASMAYLLSCPGLSMTCLISPR